MKETAQSFFTAEEKEALKFAILNAELETSGEIRVHVENICKGDVMDRASQVFKNMEMHKTKLRNGVLFYLALKNRKFAIIGDVGINTLVPDNFWAEVKLILIEHFRNNEFVEGLIEGINLTGEQLKKHFPHQSDDVNELSDELSFGRN